jgi:hypothetical protein
MASTRQGSLMSYEYRIAEGIILRCLIDAPGNLEAWSPVRRCWFVFDKIDEYWLTRARRLAAADVPTEALQAATSYEEAG